EALNGFLQLVLVTGVVNGFISRGGLNSSESLSPCGPSSNSVVLTVHSSKIMEVSLSSGVEGNLVPASYLFLSGSWQSCTFPEETHDLEAAGPCDWGKVGVTV
ncbi:hypothetical protein Tco_0171083, partial [Tanacetum coccineum]